MTIRPSDLAERISSHREPDDGLPLETIRLPVEAARATAREILSRSQPGGYVTIVERWRQLPRWAGRVLDAGVYGQATRNSTKTGLTFSQCDQLGLVIASAA
jgi:hypothetical protein